MKQPVWGDTRISWYQQKQRRRSEEVPDVRARKLEVPREYGSIKLLDVMER